MPVTLYTQPGCAPCVGVKGMLNRKGKSFNEINVREDPEAAEFIRSLGATGTPVLAIGDTHYTRVSDMRDQIAAL